MKKLSKETVGLLLKILFLVVVILIVPLAILVWLSGYQIFVGSIGIWVIFFILFIWLFGPVRILTSKNELSLQAYFKQLFFDTKVIILFIWNLLISNFNLLWKIITGLIKQISKK